MCAIARVPNEEKGARSFVSGVDVGVVDPTARRQIVVVPSESTLVFRLGARKNHV